MHSESWSEEYQDSWGAAILKEPTSSLKKGEQTVSRVVQALYPLLIFQQQLTISLCNKISMEKLIYSRFEGVLKSQGHITVIIDISSSFPLILGQRVLSKKLNSFAEIQKITRENSSDQPKGPLQPSTSTFKSNVLGKERAFTSVGFMDSFKVVEDCMGLVLKDDCSMRILRPRIERSEVFLPEMMEVCYIIKKLMSRSNRAEQLHSKLELIGSQCEEKASEAGKLLIDQNPSYPQKDLSLDSYDYYQRTTQEKPLLAPEGSQSASVGGRGDDWTPSDEQLLMELHNRKGNRWVEIARELHRNDNAVKNHYHSRLRKTLRKINKCLSDHSISSRPLKNSLISKIVQTAQEIYSGVHLQPSSPPQLAYNLKNRILQFSSLNQQQLSSSQVDQVLTLVSEIDLFTKGLKNSPKMGAKPKQNSSKYKGKEILSLLTENQRSQAQLPPPANSRRSLSFLTEVEEEQEKIEQRETGNRASFSAPTASSPGSPKNMQGFYCFNEAMFPFQPVYYPVYQSSPFFYSGRQSSFASYHPQSEVLHDWSSMKVLDEPSPFLEVRPKQSLS